MIILDTSFLIDYFRGVDGTEDIIGNEEVAVTAITYHEIMAGIKRKRAKKEEKFFRRFFSNITILNFGMKEADESSSIASRLMSLGRVINAMDVLIAGIMLANGIEKILTSDEDFKEIAKVVDIEVISYR